MKRQRFMRFLRGLGFVVGFLFVAIFGLGFRFKMERSRFEKPLRAPMKMKVVGVNMAAQNSGGWLELPTAAMMKFGQACTAYLYQVDDLTGCPDLMKAAAIGVAEESLRRALPDERAGWFTGSI